MSSTRTTAVAEHLAMLSLGGTPGALYLASVAAGTIVQCSREMQQVGQLAAGD